MNKKFFVVDRIEGDSIVLEDYKGEITIVNCNKFKVIPSEGDVLTMDKYYFIVDDAETNNRREHIKSIMKGIWGE